MSDIKWTADQSAAIEARGKNILVSAAAGSGKTAVLVERILRRVMEEKANIDEMLIVTFTNAAAAEMKEKINKRIRAYEAKSEAEARHKRRQLACISDADISTIDSFCIRCVRSNAHELDIAQDFRICDEAMGNMIVDEAAQTLLDSYYNSEDSSEFIRLTERYCDQYKDAPLVELLTRIYDFIQDYENPMEKLDEIFRFYVSGSDIYSQEWAISLMKKQLEDIAELKKQFNADGTDMLMEEFSDIKNSEVLSGIKGYDRVEAIEAYVGNVVRVMELADADITAYDSRELWDMLLEVRDFIRTSSKPLTVQLSAKEKKEPGAENAKKVYDTLIKQINDTLKACGGFDHILIPCSELERQYEDICQSVVLIKTMVRKLCELIFQIKRRRNTYTFQDIEHMTYELLNDEENEVAAQYRIKYSDIMIDEYQDTNALQDAIFRKISRDNKNIFMVGDLKQSIYAFRGGDPTIFADKGARYENYKSNPSDGASGIRIDLSANFRSNGCVVDAINSLFEFIMTEEVGDVDYGKEGEKLVCGRDADESKLSAEELATRKKPEIVSLPFVMKKGSKAVENGSVIGSRVIEARYIARRIREMIDSGETIFDGGEVRPIKYSDITVIGSSIKHIAGIYNEEFAKENIPLAVPVMGYYDNYEIVTVLSLLRLLINRHLDIPLAAVMRSPIGGFSDEELAQISYGGGRVSLYEKLIKACRVSKPGEGESEDETRAEFERAAERETRLRRVRGKIERFIGMLDRFESFKRYKNVAAIIYDIYTETHFYDFVGALEDGETAQQNLTLLYEKAKQYSQAGDGTLYGFVKYMEKVSADSENEKGTSLVNEEQNVVRMMTIHGSKGLEFPVIFAIGLGNNFVPQRYREGIIHREAGIGLGYRDPEEKSRSEFPIYTWVKDKILCENRGEDMRKLYVLLTRARERLICVIAKRYDNAEQYRNALYGSEAVGEQLCIEFNERERGRSAGQKVETEAHLEKSHGFYEWIFAACSAEAMRQGVENSEEMDVWDYSELSEEEIQGLYDGDVYKILEESYRFEHLTDLPSKTTVSKIKANEHEKNSTFEPVFVMNLDAPGRSSEEKKIPTNVMGTAYHQVMAFIEPQLDMTPESAAAMIERTVKDGELEERVAQELKCELISGFYKSGTVGEQVVEAYKAGRLYRETPFEMGITPDIYEPMLDSDSYCDGDIILLQGTVDCWFEDEMGNCTVIDYKTDRIGSRSVEEFKADKLEEYKVQLDLYSQAINRLEGKRVVKRYLYLFAINEFAEVPTDGVEQL